MRYLFFDLEFASSKEGYKVCEFGYTVTNESFKVVEKNNLIINPRIPRRDWDWYALKKILTRRIEEYERRPTFDKYFRKISELIKSADLIFGHTVNGDATAINDECKRYELPCLDYDFYDIVPFYKKLYEAESSVALATMVESLGIIGGDNNHDAGTDSFNTMLVLSEMLKQKEITLSDLIAECPEAFDQTRDYVLKSYIEDLKRKEEKFFSELSGDGTNEVRKSKVNKRRVIQFLDNLVQCDDPGEKLYEQCVAISTNYEAHHFSQILNLAQLIVDQGGYVTRKVSESNIFVTYELIGEDGEPIHDKGLACANAVNEDGGSIRIITLEELLSMLEITEEALDAMPVPSFDFLLSEDAYISDEKDAKLIKKILEKRKSEQ